MRKVRSGRAIDAALCKKGFIREVRGKHIRYFWSDNREIRMMMSHGMMGSIIDANIMSEMVRQLRLTKDQFLEFIDCSMDENTYGSIVSVP